MNLAELRNRIKNYSDYRPTNGEYDNELDDIINDAYRRVWSHKRWSFATTETWLSVYPILNFGRTGVKWSGVDGQRVINFLGGDLHVLEWASSTYEGNIIELAGREYTILKVVSTTQLILSEPLRLQSGYTIDITGNEDWFIKARYYRLPIDCAEILTLAQRDAPMGSGGTAGRGQPPYGKIMQLNARRDAELGLLVDYASAWAESYIPTSPTIVPSAFKTDVEVVQTDETPPIGRLNADEWYEICWAFVSPDGFVGSLSQPKLIQGGSVDTSLQTPTYYTLNVKFLTFDDKEVKADLSNYSSGPYRQRRFEGLKKRLFYNANLNPLTGERLGEPCWQEIRVGGATEATEPTTADDGLEALDTDATKTITWNRSFFPGTPRWNWSGRTYWRIRPYPMIDTWSQEYPYTLTDSTTPPRPADYFKRLQLIYYRRIEPLVLPTDVPELPHEFHDVIFRVAMSVVLFKNGDNVRGSIYEREANTALKELSKRYVIQVDMEWQRSQFYNNQAYRSPYNTQSLRKIQ